MDCGESTPLSLLLRRLHPTPNPRPRQKSPKNKNQTQKEKNPPPRSHVTAPATYTRYLPVAPPLPRRCVPVAHALRPRCPGAAFPCPRGGVPVAQRGRRVAPRPCNTTFPLGLQSWDPC